MNARNVRDGRAREASAARRIAHTGCAKIGRARRDCRVTLPDAWRRLVHGSAMARAPPRANCRARPCCSAPWMPLICAIVALVVPGRCALWPAGRGANRCAMIDARTHDVAAEHALRRTRIFRVAAAGRPPLRRGSGDIVTAGLNSSRVWFGPVPGSP
ncbi:hypothetical protein F511_46829 [Dorcoceras hygrometricum]|uniref:Uncharacterized protein n=1 Tax=Dorcoceras hygrometricum TaxID=472368 RepID=A0A2Z6ZSK2_9LAMI|nr:hypothetical protein F511_46829 [Dorcoceras hygrometricum]